MFFNKVRLPISIEEYDNLTDKLIRKYGFKDRDYVKSIVSVAIRRLPNENAYITLDFLAQCIWKAMSNHVAAHVGDLIRHTVQVDQLVSFLRQNPNDCQTLDQLRKYASDGFEYAKTELAKLEAQANPQSPVSLVPNQPPAESSTVVS
jgi:hypothetical protein